MDQKNDIIQENFPERKEVNWRLKGHTIYKRKNKTNREILLT